MRDQTNAKPAFIRPTPQAVGASVWRRINVRGDNILMLAVYVGIALSMALMVIDRAHLSGLQLYGSLVALSIMLVLNALLKDFEHAWGEPPAHRFHIISSSVLLTVAIWLGLDERTFLPYLLFILCGQAIVMLGPRRGILFTLGGFAVWLALAWLKGSRGDSLLDNALSVGLGLLFTTLFCTVIVGYNRQREHAEELLRQLQIAHDQLAASREREKDLAAAEERVRLAREIHDGLGHHLTVLNVQLQAASKLVVRDPARAQAAIATSREVALAAMNEVRQSVAVMRQTPLDGRTLDAALAALVRDFDQRSPLTAMFVQHGTLPTLNPAQSMTIYRAAQEGLTNAQKHAAAGTVHVDLWSERGYVRLCVQDDGQKATHGAGFGLAGLRERAEQLGGRFQAGPSDKGGFRLEIELPISS